MGDDPIPRYSIEDDLEEAAERANRELPGQVRRARERVAEAGRRLSRRPPEDEAKPSGR